MSNKSKSYSAAKLANFKKIVNEKLEKFNEEIQSLKKGQKRQKEHIANTNVDFNENSKHFQQQAKNKQLIRRLQGKSRQLESALKRIEEGTYGICERSGNLIREERLLAMPTATFDIVNNRD